MNALRVWQSYVAEVLSGRRPVGDAETQHRAGLPEEIRLRAKPVFIARCKAKPGRVRHARHDLAQDRDSHANDAESAAAQSRGRNKENLAHTVEQQI
jgi:hypothetical protein